MDIDNIFRPNLNNEIFALQNIGYTISDLAKLFDKTITKRLYNDLSELNKNNITFLNIYFCKDLGKFSTSNLNCLCHLGIFGGHCQTYGIEIWGKAGNLVFQIIFGNIFFILMSIMIFRLVSTIKNSNHNTICSLITFIISTPKNLVNLNLFVITITKFIYMIIDPYCQYKYVSYKYDRVIDELKYSAVISIYFILFIVFVGLNANLRRGKGNISKKNYICAYKLIKVIVIIILFWIYPTQISMSALLSENDAQLGGMIYLVFGGLFLAFCLYVTTFWILFYLRNKLFKQYQIKKRNLRKEKIKITEIENLYDINNNEMEILNSENHLLSKRVMTIKKNKNIIDFLIMIFQFNLIKEVDKAIDRNKDNIIEDYELMDFDKEMLIIDEYKNQNNNNNIYKICDNINENQQFNKSKTQNDSEEDFSLNESDLKIVNDIFNLSFLYMIVTIEFLLYNSIIRHIFSGIYITFVIFFIINLVDVQYIIIIYFVFFKNSIIQEYQNLKYIGELDKLTNKKGKGIKKYLNYENLKHSLIFPRFNDFINFYDEESI